MLRIQAPSTSGTYKTVFELDVTNRTYTFVDTDPKSRLAIGVKNFLVPPYISSTIGCKKNVKIPTEQGSSASLEEYRQYEQALRYLFKTQYAGQGFNLEEVPAKNC